MEKTGSKFIKVFDKASTVVSCHICGSKLAMPRGGKAMMKGEVLEVIE